MGMGPVSASQAKTGWRHQELDLLEINEAFAAQAIAVNRPMDWDPSKINALRLPSATPLAPPGAASSSRC